MKAMVHHEFGAPARVLKLEDVERPTPVEGQVLVRVHASAANPYDWHFIKGEPFFIRLGPGGLRAPKHPIPGGDFAGVVEAVGPGDIDLEVGEEVYGFCHGAFAEYVACPMGRLAKKPAGLTFEQAASLPLAATTAWQGLRDVGGIEAGQKVLIIGASGGIGSLAVQMATAWGAKVTGVCSAPNVALVRSLGADHVIDYTRDDFTRGQERYDLAFQLGGTASPLAIRKVLTESGTLVQCAGDGGKLLGPLVNILTAMVSNRFVEPEAGHGQHRRGQGHAGQIRDMVEAGSLQAVIDSTFPFEEAGWAVKFVEEGRPGGKVVITGA